VYDLIIKQVRIMDGSGAPSYLADVAILGDTIALIGELSAFEAKETIAGNGLALAPGFIDLHTHSDSNFLAGGEAHSHIRQGVTTAGLGNCGGSAAPRSPAMLAEGRRMQQQQNPDLPPYEGTTVADYFAEVDKRGISQNAVFWVGQGTIRNYVMGFDSSPANEEQLAAMKQLVRQAMEDGAVGVSTGLIYTPGVYAEEAEIIELIKETTPYGGIYNTHIRGENDTVFTALNEAINIARQAKVPVQISHLKAMGRHMWGQSKEILQLLDDAVAEGIDVTFDQYPYTAAATGLDAALPPWSHVGGKKKLVERLQDPAEKARILADVINPEGIDGWFSIWKGVGWENIMVTGYSPDRDLEGKSVAEIGEIWGMDPWDACCELIIRRGGDRVSIVYFAMGDEDVERIMQHRLQMVGSDSSGTNNEGPSRGKAHPRGYGSFVKVLGHYARDVGLFSQEEAVRKMSAAPALRIRLKDRGFIHPGKKADLVLFDPATVNSQGDYVNPSQFPVGICKVWVNGVLTVDGDKHTGAKAGKMIRRQEIK